MHETPIPVFIGCDWGSSNFRLALLGRGGELIEEYTDEGGIVQLRMQGQDTDGLINHLRAGLVALSQISAMDLSALPIIISGMAGSSLGICEVPYARLPLSPNGDGMIVHPAGPWPSIKNHVALISGICSENDVMRGEETEAVGLLSSVRLQDVRMILPGTHSKHIWISDGRIRSFKTYMTGELFQVLSSQTILKHAMKDAQIDPFDDHGRRCFTEGLEMACNSDPLQQLFTFRSEVLLDHKPVKGNIHRLSGFLIGLELRELEKEGHYPTIVGGSGPLHDRYMTAMEHKGWAQSIIPVAASERREAVWRGQASLALAQRW